MSKFLDCLAPSVGGALGVVGVAYMLADQFVVDLPAPAQGALAPSSAQAAQALDPEASVPTAGDPARSVEGGFGLGREALPKEIAAWDIDVRPDGTGLPEGSGDVFTGEQVFIEQCAVCHGDFAEGVDRWPVLAGGEGTLTNDRPVKTIGSYWPYLSTVFDYVNRAMPFGYAQSLSADDVYAITAYLLYSNYIVDDDFVLSHENFTEVRMPNEENFFMDDRADGEIPEFTAEPCMTDCKDSVEITARAAILDVTPEDAAARKAREAEAAAAQSGAAEVEEVAAADTAAAPPSDEEASHGGPDPELVAAGEKAFRQCQACHMVGGDAQNRVRPILTGIVGAPAAAVDGFNYSDVFRDAAAEGLVWTEAELAAFLADPRGTMKGTKMAFAGVRKDEDIGAIIAYLKSTAD